MEKLTQKLYKLMDSFLVETSVPRSLENLNKDRHLFVEGVIEAIKERDEFIIGKNTNKFNQIWSEKHDDIAEIINTTKSIQKKRAEESR